VRADRTRVKQVFVNLLSNAIKYNRVGGRSRSAAPGLTAGPHAHELADTGNGPVPAQAGAAVPALQPAGPGAGTEEGTGIGLVVSKRLVELMGGDIGVDSTVGVGSTFWVELPARRNQLACRPGRPGAGRRLPTPSTPKTPCPAHPAVRGRQPGQPAAGGKAASRAARTCELLSAGRPPGVEWRAPAARR
jgi:hypothetical protein